MNAWKTRRLAGAAPGNVWPLLRLFTAADYAKKVLTRRSLTNPEMVRLRNGILQASEYFAAAERATLATSPVLLYYGMVHLGNAVLAASGVVPKSSHGLPATA